MRAGGILLPVFSLPGDYGIGCFSKKAYEFVDFLEKSGQKYWQILPLGPTSYGDSPYQSFSTFAGNPFFIDLQQLIDEGLLKENECKKVDFGDNPHRIDYAKVYKGRFPLLRKAYERSRIYEDTGFYKFKNENEFWLRDYALFMALKDFFKGESFTSWPEDIMQRYGYAMDYYQRELYYDIEFYEFIQYEFDLQWKALKSYANNKGIKIIGDAPIYVAFDSADVWAHPDLFQIDDNKKLTCVAGCPPDGFSKKGQLWGNPLYDWNRHKETGYWWWIKRIERFNNLFDVVRIDHFRGLDQYYSIPANSNDATKGHWVDGPGMELFEAIRNRLGKINIIAEDLGFITDSVRELVRRSGFPNMKIIEFAFDSREGSGPGEYLPYNYDKNCVVYTGTHDNETLAGWIGHIKKQEKDRIRAYVGSDLNTTEDFVNALIRLAVSSTADFAIIPLQDYMCLGDEARINTPSTLGDNWVWRFDENAFSKKLSDRIREYAQIYGRA